MPTGAGSAQFPQSTRQAIIASPPPDHPIPDPQVLNGVACFHDLSHHLVAEVDSLMRRQSHGRHVEAGIDKKLVQIATADTAQPIAHAHPVRRGKWWFWQIYQL
jgi:hypothetical protein